MVRRNVHVFRRADHVSARGTDVRPRLPENMFPKFAPVTPASLPFGDLAMNFRRPSLAVLAGVASLSLVTFACGSEDAGSDSSRSADAGGAASCSCSVRVNGVDATLACGTSKCVSGARYACGPEAELQETGEPCTSPASATGGATNDGGAAPSASSSSSPATPATTSAPATTAAPDAGTATPSTPATPSTSSTAECAKLGAVCALCPPGSVKDSCQKLVDAGNEAKCLGAFALNLSTYQRAGCK